MDNKKILYLFGVFLMIVIVGMLVPASMHPIHHMEGLKSYSLKKGSKCGSNKECQSHNCKNKKCT